MTHGYKAYRYCGGILLVCLLLLSGIGMAVERSTGEVVDDALVTSKIKARFAADPQVSALAINVDTVKGVVTLTGVVDNESARQRAMQLAQETEGVQRVDVANLHVKH